LRRRCAIASGRSVLDATVGLWLAFLILILALLVFDLGVLHRRPREIGVAEALWLSLGYVVVAVLFGLGVAWFRGVESGTEFFAGYLIEKSLSLDNIFVFALLFAHFAVPRAQQHRVLFWGVVGALLMRAVLIFAGAALLEAFHWVVYVFGALLILSGLKMLRAVDQHPDPGRSRLLALLRRWLPVAEGERSDRFLVRRDGGLMVTPLFLVLVLIELSDLLFAVDSIPAIFAVTTDPFIVLSANAFAILGLRALYFALAGILHRFRYLKHGLSLVLVLVGAKMILNGLHGGAFAPPAVTLGLTAAILAGSILLSLLRPAPAAGAQR
jgi:tellurite resistance protein TerC